MPELPEVETIRHDLRQKILNKKIKAASILRPSTVRSDRRQFTTLLKRNKITEIDRVGKLLIFNLSNRKHFLMVHLKMTGQLLYQWGHKVVAGGHSATPLDFDLPNKYTRVIISFIDQSQLFFNDLRAFGYMRLVGEAEKRRVVAQFGLEPLTKKFTLKRFHEQFNGRQTNVKAVLMNQALFAGIGNIYADEACFRAGIRPSRRADRLTRQEVKRLHRAVESVLRVALRERGTTFNNYVDPHGRKGNFLKYLKVYGRGGQPCLVCRHTLTKKKVAGRGTVFCARCQK